ncbi:MAG: DUF1080 domain-containing protein [Planctomycetes bacterium]|nr:DUF1080 domain-containing protein [Planctomycetota bacterium]MBL7143412.1 DUF1080 domain-containing protein [Phycisphaerae bacterium]
MRQNKLNSVKIAIFLTALVIFSTCAIAAGKSKTRRKPNTLTDKQISQGWKLLFDGKTLTGFKGATDDKVLNTCWKAGKGQIFCTERDTRPDKLGGSIVTKDQYGSFDFRLDYKLDPDFGPGHVNSGVKYFAYPKTELGLEYQIYDHDAKVEGPHALADLYDILPAKERPAKPRGQWNKVRIVSKGNQVEHWINGKKVLQFERGGEQFRNAVAKSKFKNHDKFGEAEQGYILLQDHGGGITFRNIKIRPLED